MVNIDKDSEEFQAELREERYKDLKRESEDIQFKIDGILSSIVDIKKILTKNKLKKNNQMLSWGVYIIISLVVSLLILIIKLFVKV